ncbi:hypothetical protein APHAL10511_000291 [Amanita phalloides]|nr:hypothetical protein APHAL10511_000291 [Amanita phalloides]
MGSVADIERSLLKIDEVANNHKRRRKEDGRGHPRVCEGDEQTILEHYVYDVINTTIGTLNVLVKAPRRSPVAGTFLLNNIRYLNAHVLQSQAWLSEFGREVIAEEACSFT